MTKKEIKNLAIDIVDGKVFLSTMLDYPMEAMIVFLPLIFVSAELKKEDIGLIYQYYSEALPRTINGKPIFDSFKTLTNEQTNYLNACINEYQSFKTNFTEDEEEM